MPTCLFLHFAFLQPSTSLGSGSGSGSRSGFRPVSCPLCRILVYLQCLALLDFGVLLSAPPGPTVDYLCYPKILPPCILSIKGTWTTDLPALPTTTPHPQRPSITLRPGAAQAAPFHNVFHHQETEDVPSRGSPPIGIPLEAQSPQPASRRKPCTERRRHGRCRHDIPSCHQRRCAHGRWRTRPRHRPRRTRGASCQARARGARLKRARGEWPRHTGALEWSGRGSGKC